MTLTLIIFSIFPIRVYAFIVQNSADSSPKAPFPEAPYVETLYLRHIEFFN